MNATEKWIGDLNKAMPEIDGLDISERLRKTLKRACASAIVEAEDRLVDNYTRRNEDQPWGDKDSAELKRILDTQDAPLTWSEERMRIEQLALHFGRPGKYMLKKAIELGIGPKLDYFGNPKRIANLRGTTE